MTIKTCKWCNKEFKNKRDHNEICIYFKQMKYKCKLCKYYTEVGYEYKKHVKTKLHCKNYNICIDCGLSFSSTYHLSMHQYYKETSGKCIKKTTTLTAPSEDIHNADIEEELPSTSVMIPLNFEGLAIKDIPLTDGHKKRGKYYYLRQENEYNVDTFLLKCYCCLKPININDNECHRSHDIPESRGGNWSKDNIYLCCSKCNSKMGNNFGVHEYRQLLNQ